MNDDLEADTCATADKNAGPMRADVEDGGRQLGASAGGGTRASELLAAVVLAESRMHAAEADYALRMAAVARAARRGGAGAKSAVRQCASVLGITRQTLQPYALVAMRWTHEELRSLFERQDCHGRRMSLSHLLILCRLPLAERRRRAEETLSEGLPVHELRRRIRASRRSTLEATTATPDAARPTREAPGAILNA